MKNCHEHSTFNFTLIFLFFAFQLKLAQQKEVEKQQLLEKRAEYKKKTEGLLKFSAAEMAAKERAANKARKVNMKFIERSIYQIFIVEVVL